MSLAQLAEMDLISPRSLEEACDELARLHQAGKKVWALAGCTDWMVERHMSPIDQGRLDAVALDVTRLPELRGIEVDGDVMSVGAAEPFLSMRRHAVVRERCPMLAEMASEVGALQIQARGTLGGNLVTGSPAADGVTALFALDADVVLRGVEGGVVTRIGFGAASVAEVILPLASVRASVLGRAPRDLNLNQLEEAVDREIRPIDDVRSTARYRRHVTKVLVRGFLEGLS
jgi:CO/xanthine dehydrogenase FAD-binding subunit